MLKDLAVASDLPWCIIGDFNDLMTEDEKKGGKHHPRALLKGFSETIMDCGLTDLGFTGDKFTWERWRGSDRWISERLDRGLATSEWRNIFPLAEIKVHELSTSDHLPLFLQLNKQVYMPRSKRFRFENMWIQESECRNIVQDCWNDKDNSDILNKMALCCAKLEEWGGGMIKDLKDKMAGYRRDMQRLRSRRDSVGVHRYGEARWNFLKLLEKQEVFWRQRAKQYWLRDGDNNTRFFHKFASIRREHNKIKRLKNEVGEWQDTEDKIQDTIISYFETMFTATTTEEQLSERLTFKRITEEQSYGLIQPVEEEEIRAAVFAMYPDKSPGIDGFNPCFFQVYWAIVKQDVVAFCKNFFDHGVLPENVKRTLVCLIPKVKQPKQVSDLRPISLCNVLMRILSKVMANRLKPCLNSVISSQQSAFIEGRLLTDNALVAFEINHYIHRKTQRKCGVAALKIDVAKAYDRLEWRFIETMLIMLGFPQVWIQRVMQCVKSVSYSFLRDGKIFGDVRPQRGIRQGDPISPYLYILCAEGLTGLMRIYEDSGLIHGCKVARGAPGISHLLFADDCYFFFRATHTEGKCIRDILTKYELLSGQLVNYGKSDIVFSPNTSVVDRGKVCDCLGVKEVSKPGKYLGMPMCVGKGKKDVFGFISDRVQHKLQAWCNKELSKAGKLTLLKSSAQTMPTFWMSLFLIPDSICDEIEKKMNAFFWSGGSTGKGVKWCAWKRLCMPKDFGGLGLKELTKFNRAMLAKQGWRLLIEANPLVSAIMKARYYPGTSVLNAELGSNPSYVWRGIFQALEAV